MNASVIENLRRLVNDIHVEEKLIRFIVSVVTSTRQNKSIYLGASPRASIGILAVCKGYCSYEWTGFCCTGRYNICHAACIATPPGTVS